MTVSPNDKLSASIKKSESAPSVGEDNGRKLRGPPALLSVARRQTCARARSLCPPQRSCSSLNGFSIPERGRLSLPFPGHLFLSTGTASLMSAQALLQPCSEPGLTAKLAQGRKRVFKIPSDQFPGLVHRVPA